MTRPYSLARAVVLPLAAFTALVISGVPTRAQGPTAPPPPPLTLAPDDAVAQLGVVQGDYVVPYSSIETPDQVGVSLHTHLLISRRLMAAANAAATGNITLTSNTPMIATMLGSSLMGFPLPGVLGGQGSPPAPNATGSGPQGSYLPADIKKAYGLATTGGAGTIVLIGAYDYPTALSDFNYFSNYTGLPQETSTNRLLNTNKVFQVVYATGRQPNAQPSGQNFSLEAALDIEWAHAMAPNAKIVLVEANTNNTVDLLFGAVAKGNNLPGVREMSMSYGGGEYSSQTYFDATFSQSGIVYFASSGDTGGDIEWPSSSQYVVGVGGTTLTTNSSTQARVSETGWSDSGGGVSAYETKPSWQSGVTLNGTPFSKRATPDVALVADPNTGVLIIWSGGGTTNGGYIVGGTSLAAPATAGIVNLSLSNRASTYAELTQVYSVYNNAALYSGNFRDITSGTAGSNSCLTGFDLVTGIGTPIGSGGY